MYAGHGDVVELSKDGDVVEQNIAEIDAFGIIAPGYDIIATSELINVYLI